MFFISNSESTSNKIDACLSADSETDFGFISEAGSSKLPKYLESNNFALAAMKKIVADNPDGQVNLRHFLSLAPDTPIVYLSIQSHQDPPRRYFDCFIELMPADMNKTSSIESQLDSQC